MRVGWRALAVAGLRASGWVWMLLGLVLLVYQCETWFVSGVWPPVTLETAFGIGGASAPSAVPTEVPFEPIGAVPLAPLLITLGVVVRLATGRPGRQESRTAGTAPAVR